MLVADVVGISQDLFLFFPGPCPTSSTGPQQLSILDPGGATGTLMAYLW